MKESHQKKSSLDLKTMIVRNKTLLIVVLISFVILLLNVQSSNGNIHRAVPGTVQGNILRNQKLNKSGSLEIEEDGEEDDFTFFEKLTLKANVSWLWAIAASLVVGSTGIFPLLIFKVEDGHSLKEASKFSFVKITVTKSPSNDRNLLLESGEILRTKKMAC